MKYKFTVGDRVEIIEDIKHSGHIAATHGEQGEILKLIIQDNEKLAAMKVQFDDYNPHRTMCLDCCARGYGFVVYPREVRLVSPIDYENITVEELI